LSFEINGIFQLLNKNTYFIGKSLEIQPTAATTAAAAAAPSIIISSSLLLSYFVLYQKKEKVGSNFFLFRTQQGQVRSNFLQATHAVQ
jgi:hypothetical protein